MTVTLAETGAGPFEPQLRWHSSARSGHTVQTIFLGRDECERIEVRVHAYERAPVGDFHDDNWLRVSVDIRAGAFSGAFEGAFLAPEFSDFRDRLRILHETLRGTARFSTLEEQLSLELVGDGLGHIALKGMALDAPGMGNRLEFHLDLDQGHLATALLGLDNVVETFPVRTGVL